MSVKHHVEATCRMCSISTSRLLQICRLLFRFENVVAVCVRRLGSSCYVSLAGVHRTSFYLDGRQVVELAGDVNGGKTVVVESVDVSAGVDQRLDDHLVTVLGGQRQRTVARLKAPVAIEHVRHRLHFRHLVQLDRSPESLLLGHAQ